jgi:superfamily II DNA or RNA helicase
MNASKTLSKFCEQSDQLNKFLNEPQNLIWNHQVDATIRIRDHLSDRSKPNIALCVLPTGSGKSGIAVLSAYACKAERVLVITPSKHISKQMFNSFCDTNGAAFLVKRRIIKSLKDFERHCRPTCADIVTNTNDINSYFNKDLVIANAHKFGSNSRVSIDAIPTDAVDLVIVDEAHHYPAETWRAIVDHFSNAKKLFLTATPKYKKKDILPNQQDYICYDLSRETLVDRGIIRDISFSDNKKSLNEVEAFNAISIKVKEKLLQHDSQDQNIIHQAMVLCQTIKDLNAVDNFVSIYNQNVTDEREKCYAFTGNTTHSVLNGFKKHAFRTLVICGCLLEGFDHPNVSVVGIARNVQSPIIFAQFIGRSFRKVNNTDTVIASIVTDQLFNQKPMWDRFEKLPDNDLSETEDDDSFVTVASPPEQDYLIPMVEEVLKSRN